MNYLLFNRKKIQINWKLLVLIILIICLILQFLLLQPPGCTQDSDCQMPGKNGKYSSHPINLKLVQIIFKFCEVMKNGQILTHWMNILRGRISAFVNLNTQDFSGDCVTRICFMIRTYLDLWNRISPRYSNFRTTPQCE